MIENSRGSGMRESILMGLDDISQLDPAFIDIEKQEIKGILKKPYKEHEYTTKVIKCMLSFGVFLLCFPLVIGDLFYGSSGETCIQDYPTNLSINLQIYLLVAAVITLLTMGLVILCISRVSYRDGYSTRLYFVTIPRLILTGGTLFLLAWNIVGAVIFWGMTYNKVPCGKNISTYLFISIIMKLIGNLIILCARY
jgi:hypothetical protein